STWNCSGRHKASTARVRSTLRTCLRRLGARTIERPRILDQTWADASRIMGSAMILPKDRDPRFITIRRGGTLTDSDHWLLALWAATCAEHVLNLFESVQPSDPRPRLAIEQIRAWTGGDIRMSESRAAGGHAMGAARELSGAARYAAYAAG